MELPEHASMPGTVGATAEKGLRGSVITESLSLHPRTGVKKRQRLLPHLCISVGAFGRLKRNLIIFFFFFSKVTLILQVIKERI